MLEQIKVTNLKKRLRLQAINLKEGYRLLLLFFIGIIIGTLFINLFCRINIDKICVYGNYLIKDSAVLNKVSLDKGGFFAYCARKYIFQVIILIGLNCIFSSRLINGLLCIYKGCTISVLICIATVLLGGGGVLVFLISIFPHYLIYVPMFIFTLYFSMNFKDYIRNSNYICGIIKGCLIESMLIVMTAFFEAYMNLPLLIYVFS